MKNLYLLPTDQPTGIFETNSGLQFSIMNKVRYGEFKGFHIYITSDEEIGEGDWYLDTTVNVIFKNNKLFLNGTGYKKIILSTDPTLIADRVQAIDDNFLEWFVKNSYCGFVVIDWSPLSKNLYGWKIIIPQEEPKEEIQMYSEGEVYELLCQFFDDHVNAQDANITQWFEKNKKK